MRGNEEQTKRETNESSSAAVADDDDDDAKSTRCRNLEFIIEFSWPEVPERAGSIVRD